MGSLLRYLIIALFIVLIGSWLFTVPRACNVPTTPTIETPHGDPGLNDAGQTDANNDSDLEDLYEPDESDVKTGNADKTGQLPTNAEAADDLQMDDAGDQSPNTTPAPPKTTTTTTKQPASSNNGSTFGKYLVVTGSYLSEANAKIWEKKLEAMGYKSAEVIVFDLSQYYSVTAGRYNSLSEGRQIAKKLSTKGMEAYVHKMRGKRVD